MPRESGGSCVFANTRSGRLSQAAHHWAPVQPVPCPPPCPCRSPRAAQRGAGAGLGGSGRHCPWVPRPTLDVGCAFLTHRRGTKWSRVSTDGCKDRGRGTWVMVEVGCAGAHVCSGLRAGCGLGRAPQEAGEPGLRSGVRSTRGARRPAPPFMVCCGEAAPLPSRSLSCPLRTAAAGCAPAGEGRALLVSPSAPSPDAPRGGSSPKWGNPSRGVQDLGLGPHTPQITVPTPIPRPCWRSPRELVQCARGPRAGLAASLRPRVGAHLGLGPCRQ